MILLYYNYNLCKYNIIMESLTNQFNLISLNDNYHLINNIDYNQYITGYDEFITGYDEFINENDEFINENNEFINENKILTYDVKFFDIDDNDYSSDSEVILYEDDNEYKDNELIY